MQTFYVRRRCDLAAQIRDGDTSELFTAQCLETAEVASLPLTSHALLIYHNIFDDSRIIELYGHNDRYFSVKTAKMINALLPACDRAA